jgi:hypothetical protein
MNAERNTDSNACMDMGVAAWKKQLKHTTLAASTIHPPTCLEPAEHASASQFEIVRAAYDCSMLWPVPTPAPGPWPRMANTVTPTVDRRPQGASKSYFTQTRKSPFFHFTLEQSSCQMVQTKQRTNEPCLKSCLHSLRSLCIARGCPCIVINQSDIIRWASRRRITSVIHVFFLCVQIQLINKSPRSLHSSGRPRRSLRWRVVMATLER